VISDSAILSILFLTTTPLKMEVAYLHSLKLGVALDVI
jgi:hypothetical protein